MLWIVAYREDGEKIGRRTAWGRAAAIAAAVDLIDQGIEVLSVIDKNESKPVSEDEIRQVRELRRVPLVHLSQDTPRPPHRQKVTLV